MSATPIGYPYEAPKIANSPERLKPVIYNVSQSFCLGTQVDEGRIQIEQN